MPIFVISYCIFLCYKSRYEIRIRMVFVGNLHVSLIVLPLFPVSMSLFSSLHSISPSLSRSFLSLVRSLALSITLFFCLSVSLSLCSPSLKRSIYLFLGLWAHLLKEFNFWFSEYDKFDKSVHQAILKSSITRSQNRGLIQMWSWLLLSDNFWLDFSLKCHFCSTLYTYFILLNGK